MGTTNDEIDQLGCSDQRFVFRLVLAEARRLRKALFSASVILAQAKDTSREEALVLVSAALDRDGPKFNEARS